MTVALGGGPAEENDPATFDRFSVAAPLDGAAAAAAGQRRSVAPRRSGGGAVRRGTAPPAIPGILLIYVNDA